MSHLTSLLTTLYNLHQGPGDRCDRGGGTLLSWPGPTWARQQSPPPPLNRAPNSRLREPAGPGPKYPQDLEDTLATIATLATLATHATAATAPPPPITALPVPWRGEVWSPWVLLNRFDQF